MYHHQPIQAKQLETSEATTGRQTVELAPAGTEFEFEVTFQNLSSEELGLLLYALVLEPELAHKVGGCKPLGAGSARITVTEMVIHQPGNRYRNQGGDEILRGDVLKDRIEELTATLRQDPSDTMSAFRAIATFNPNDGRRYSYPSRKWFHDHPERQLRSWEDYRGRGEAD